jgi:hypothetical protein
MKNIIFVFGLMCLVTATLNGQGFEGTLKWSMKMEITDPKLKAQLEQAKKQMEDPAMQAQMKQAMEQMNDPKMKAMMDANPQLKAQMESTMKMMQGGGATSMTPTGFLVKIKNGNTLSSSEGGAMQTEVLFRKDQDKSFMLDRKNKTYYVLPNDAEPDSPNKPVVKVTKTSEKTTILNYRCTKYVTTVTQNGRTIDQIFWTTTEINDFDLRSLAKQRVGRGQSIFYDGLEGVPLKIEMSMPEGKMNMEAILVKRESLSASDFEIPADFKETKNIFGGRN